VDVYLPAQIENQMQFGCFIDENGTELLSATCREVTRDID
jgi:hypothetical protein